VGQRELVLPQVVFRLTVRREGLQTLSIAEAGILLESISTMIQSLIMNKDLQAQLEATFSGVMISINT